MSLIELLWLTLLILCAFLAGNSLAHRWGNLGWLVGAPIGMALWLLMTLALLRAGKIYHRYRPLRPLCRREKCLSPDYSVIKFTQWGVLFRCRCGDTYLKTGSRFAELMPDGSIRRYMVRSSFGNWRCDVGDCR
jgi:hypothetical protein